MSKITLIIMGVMMFVMIPEIAHAGLFPDMYRMHPNYDAVEYIGELGYISGFPDGKFHPERTVTRAEFLKILMNSAAVNLEDGGRANFPDVDNNMWYAPYVATAVKMGWIQGYGDGLFRPNDPVSRVEAFKILAKIQYIVAPEHATYSVYTDIPKDSWYAPYVNTFQQMQLIDDPTGLEFHPDKKELRGDIAEMVFRLFVMRSLGEGVYSSDLKDRFFNPVAKPEPVKEPEPTVDTTTPAETPVDGTTAETTTPVEAPVVEPVIEPVDLDGPVLSIVHPESGIVRGDTVAVQVGSDEEMFCGIKKYCSGTIGGTVSCQNFSVSLPANFDTRVLSKFYTKTYKVLDRRHYEVNVACFDRNRNLTVDVVPFNVYIGSHDGSSATGPDMLITLDDPEIYGFRDTIPTNDMELFKFTIESKETADPIKIEKLRIRVGGSADVNHFKLWLVEDDAGVEKLSEVMSVSDEHSGSRGTHTYLSFDLLSTTADSRTIAPLAKKQYMLTGDVFAGRAKEDISVAFENLGDNNNNHASPGDIVWRRGNEPETIISAGQIPTDITPPPIIFVNAGGVR